MTTEAVKQYFNLLVKDEEFAKKVAGTGEDKIAKQNLIKSYGMEFTKDEFEKTAKECSALLFKEDGELTEQGLEVVSGGGFGGAFGGLLMGSLIGGASCLFVGAVGGGIAGAGMGLFLPF